MCNAHPQVFPCKHTVNTFWFCPNAPFDVQTGRNLGPCRNVNYLNPAEASGDCNLVHCHFRELGGIWVCCQCGNGPQTTGWCTSPTWQWNYDWNNKVWGWVSLSCGHMCCETCVPYAPADSSPSLSIAQIRRTHRTHRTKSNPLPTTATAAQGPPVRVMVNIPRRAIIRAPRPPMIRATGPSQGRNSTKQKLSRARPHRQGRTRDLVPRAVRRTISEAEEDWPAGPPQASLHSERRGHGEHWHLGSDIYMSPSS
ncbi:hypothetical protein F5Y17DRAFT_477236 [Xylariaceae sp. FL0594]|nr:hypothetical protein F5Y17DRAFT_477236 [Xylariaceae sp. FL0594]